MKRPMYGLAVVLVTTTVMALGAAAQAAWTESPNKSGRPRVVEIKDARLKIELNATDGDAGIQVFIDSDPWKWMEIFDPQWKEDISIHDLG